MLSAYRLAIALLAVTSAAAIGWSAEPTNPPPAAPAERAVSPLPDPVPQTQAPAPGTRTICVPTLVTETCLKRVTTCRPEVRERTLTIYRRVCETTCVQQQCLEMVPEVRTCQQTCCVMRPIYKLEKHEYTMPVFEEVLRPGSHRTAKVVPASRTVLVCEDQGHWEDRCCPAPAACCQHCRHHPCTCASPCPAPCAPVATCKVWVPKEVMREMAVGYWKTEIFDEPEKTPYVARHDEKRSWSKMVVCGYRPEQEIRECQYTVCVPRTVTRSCPVTTVKCVPEQIVEKYTVQVPCVVEVPVTVTHCRMVPQQVPAADCR